jgi:hypothetical protein
MVKLMVGVDGPANRLQPPLHPVKIIRGWQLVGDPHDGHANISSVNVQLAASHQLSGHHRYLVVGQPTPQECQQWEVIDLRDTLLSSTTLTMPLNRRS